MSTVATADAAEPKRNSGYIIAFVCGMAAFLEVLDTSIANVSLIHIAGSLSATKEEATWVLTSYLLANAVVLPMTGWLADTLGRKRYYLISVALFTVTSMLCGLAPTLPALVVFRILQGMAGAALQPVSQSILGDAFPGARRSSALAVYGVAVIAAPAIGPTLGGYLTENFSWHWIFLINVPIGLLLAAVANVLIHDTAEQIEITRRKRATGAGIDYLGFSLIAISMGSLQMMLDKGQQEDWFDSDFIVACTAIASLSLVLLIWRELTHEHPIVNLRLLANRSFAVSCLLLFGMGIPMLGATLLLPQLMQTLLGYTAQGAGAVMTPAALATLIAMPIGARLSSIIDPRKVATFGFVMISASMLLMARISLDITQDQLIVLRTIQTVGAIFIFLPLNVIAWAAMPASQSNSGNAILNLMRNLGGSVGISLVVTYLARASQRHESYLQEHLSILDPAYQSTVQALGGAMSEQAAQATIVGMVARQSGMLAYLDEFYLLAGLILGMAAMVWIARRAPSGAPAKIDLH